MNVNRMQQMVTPMTNTISKVASKAASKVNPVNSPMMLIYGMKLFKVASAYVTATICANYMAQVYMDKVLVNQENPQPLTNFVIMYLVIDVLMTAMIVAMFYILSSFVGLQLGDSLNMIMQDTVWFLAIISIIGFVVSSVMFKKKYFMYKDDGLRAIRALKDIMFQSASVIAIFPFFKMKVI